MLSRLLGRIGTILNKRNIPYMIIGGQAVLLYGEPRLTKDIDIVLGLEPAELGTLKSAVEELGLSILVENESDFVEKTLVLPAEDRESGFRIDFVFSFSPYERQALARTKAVTIGGVPVRFASLEDLIIHKIVAGRPRDLDDVKGILLRNPAFDKPYVLQWLGEFDRSLEEDFTGRFEQVLRR
jgi:predicted nucleotidyltransferase